MDALGHPKITAPNVTDSLIGEERRAAHDSTLKHDLAGVPLLLTALSNTDCLH